MNNDASTPLDFAHAFGDALERFLSEKTMGLNEAARELGLVGRGGARLHAYLHDRPDKTRPKPDAEILYLLCTKLDFSFTYRGYRISAATLNGTGKKSSPKLVEQKSLEFDRQFNLMEDRGAVRVRVKRPVGKIELTVSLDAKTG